MTLSIVIPAHNEGRVVDRLLAEVAPLALQDPPAEVIVVANGCSDDTADRARAHAGVRVIELAEAGKAGALRAGDAQATLFPRFFVDADIALSRSAVERVAAAMRSTGRPAGAPQVVFDDHAASRWVRAFYRHLRTTPYVCSSLVGLGVYGLSEAGRARFDRFPDLVGDDLFIAGLFTADERLVVPDATFTVVTPRSLLNLIRVRRRVYAGNREAASAAATGSLPPQSGATSLRMLLRAEAHGPALVYFTVNASAKALARLDRRRSRVVWHRDDSSR